MDERINPNNLFNDFSSFPRLPIELKCRIWHFTFPRGREIHLDEFISIANGVNNTLNVHYLETPVAFKVNRESRQESHRVYYTFVTSRAKKNAKSSARETLGRKYLNEATNQQFPPETWTLYINPKLDIICLDIASLCSPRSPRMAWLDNTCKQYPDFLSSIQHLDLRGFDFTQRSLWHFPLHAREHFPSKSNKIGPLNRAISPLQGFIVRLKSVKTITFTERSRVGEFFQWADVYRTRECWEGSFRSLLLNHGNELGTSLPEITIRRFGEGSVWPEGTLYNTKGQLWREFWQGNEPENTSMEGEKGSIKAKMSTKPKSTNSNYQEFLGYIGKSSR